MDWFVRYATLSRPRIAGTAGRPPTLTKILSARSSSSLTFTVFLPMKRAWPRYTVVPSRPRIHISTPRLELRTMSSLRAFTRCMSMRGAPSMTTPYSPARRARCAA